MSSRWPTAAALCVSLATTEAADADSSCASSQAYCGQVTTSSAPRLNVDCYSQTGYGFAGYDIPAGTLSAFGQDGGAGFGASATMVDSFQVVGPPDGTPLAFTAQLILSGMVVSGVNCENCCFGYGSARIVEGTSNAAQATFNPFCGTMYINTTLDVQVRRAAGERFLITASVSGGGLEGGSGDIRGTLRFSNLPEGTSVLSCNGFQQEVPVPVTLSSWGRLKTRYR